MEKAIVMIDMDAVITITKQDFCHRMPEKEIRVTAGSLSGGRP